MKTFLNVPYEKKDFAKTCGAKWDALNKKWFFLGELPKALEIFNNKNYDDGGYVNSCLGLGCGRRGCDDCN